MFRACHEEKILRNKLYFSFLNHNLKEYEFNLLITSNFKFDGMFKIIKIIL